jgi:ABC-type glutathione transport system ATPase component
MYITKKQKISELNGKRLNEFRNQVQVIFQDPSASLNPNQTVENILSEGISFHKILESKSQIKSRVIELLDNVSLDKSYLKRYPHELSGGQKQRLCIARAISLNPKLIVCDEAVSALDISTQNTIIKLLNNLKKQLKLSYLFITHDLSVARLIADRILVLKKGEIVELDTTEKIFKSPKNSYTKKLVSALH